MGPTSKGREGRRWEGEENGKKEERKGRGKGREGEGKGGGRGDLLQGLRGDRRPD